MAQAAGSAEIMAAAELKPLLLLSKRKPVSCAVGMTKDKQGVILLDRRIKPRKLLANLKAKARSAGLELDTGSLRFGRASVDAATDSATVHITVNKAAPGALRMKLIEKLKPAGFQKCEFTVDDGLENESEEDEAASVEAPPDGLATPPQAAGRSAAILPSATPAGLADPAPRPPSHSGLLDDAPGHAQAMPPAAPPPGSVSPAGNQARSPADARLFDKGRQVWVAVRAKLQAEIDAVIGEVSKHYGAGGDEAELVRCSLEPILKQLDDSLAAKLAEVSAAEGAARGKLAQDAQAIIGRYKSFIDGDSIVSMLDQNPFHPVAIRKTLDTALDTLSKVVRGSGTGLARLV